MRNIFKNLLDIKSNLSLCVINLVSEKEVSIDLNGVKLKAKPSLKGNEIKWGDELDKIEPIESVLLECVLGEYIDKLININKFTENNFINKSYTLEEIKNINLDKIKENSFNLGMA